MNTNIIIKAFFTKNKKHLQNIVWSNLSQLALTFQMLAISVLLVRFLGQSLYGEFLFIYSFIAILTVTSVSGIRDVLLKAIAQDKLYTFVIATNFSLRMSFIGLSLLLITGTYFLIQQNYTYALSFLLVAPLFPAYASLQSWKFYYKGLRRFKKIACLDIARVVFQILLITALTFLTKSIVLIIFAYFFLESVINLFFYWRIKKQIVGKNIEKQWKNQSLAVTYMDFSSEIFGKADVLILGAFFSTSVVGLYGITMKIIDAIMLLIKSSITAILPVLYSRDLPYRLLFVISILVGVVSIVGVYLLRPLLSYIYGESIEAAFPYIQLYVFSVPFAFLSRISNYSLVKLNLNKQIVVNKSLAIFVVLLLYLWLIPKYGIVGGILSSSLYFILQFLLNYRLIFAK